jgi:hypothetical protein
MKTDLWQKACAVLLMMLLSLAGWGLWKVEEVNERTIRIEERILIWHTPTTSNTSLYAMPVGMYSEQLSCEQKLEFSQRTMLRAYSQIKNRSYEPALRTLMLGLEDSGLDCKEYQGSLRCE